MLATSFESVRFVQKEAFAFRASCLRHVVMRIKSYALDDYGDLARIGSQGRLIEAQFSTLDAQRGRSGKTVENSSSEMRMETCF